MIILHYYSLISVKCATLGSFVLFVLWPQENRVAFSLRRNGVQENITSRGQNTGPRDQWKWASGAARNPEKHTFLRD